MKRPPDGEDVCFTCESVSSVNGWLYLFILYIVFVVLAKRFTDTDFIVCNKLGIVKRVQSTMIKHRKSQT